MFNFFPFPISGFQEEQSSDFPHLLVPQGHVKQLLLFRRAAGEGWTSQQEWPGLPVQIASSLDAARLPDFQKLWGWAGFFTFSFSFSSVLLPYVDKWLAQSDLPRVPQKFRALTRIHRHHPREVQTAQ